MYCKAPFQLGGPTGEVAGEAASNEVAILAGALGADHLGGVLVLRRCTFLPAPDLGGAVVGLTFIDDNRLAGEQRNNGVDVATSAGLEVTGDDGSSGIDIGSPSVQLSLDMKRFLTNLPLARQTVGTVSRTLMPRV